ncbi:MAG: hypothetical protein K2X82_32930 [Gemmataceae bacterium]|nr:hypothetical protein [Gemmataceae bacterium]
MVATTFAAVVLGATLSPGAVVTPDWRTDYRQAIVVAQTDSKPVAVFIGRGAPAVPAEAAALLANKYVCLTVDTATPEGKELAGKFGMTDGLVISSAGGKVQALRHAGPVPAGELAAYLTKYGDPNRAVVTTETVGAEAAPAAVVPASYAAPVYAPARPVIRTLGGGCPNGRCPNAR